jgi:hypothetical protein
MPPLLRVVVNLLINFYRILWPGFTSATTWSFNVIYSSYATNFYNWTGFSTWITVIQPTYVSACPQEILAEFIRQYFFPWNEDQKGKKRTRRNIKEKWDAGDVYDEPDVTKSGKRGDVSRGRGDSVIMTTTNIKIILRMGLVKTRNVTLRMELFGMRWTRRKRHNNNNNNNNNREIRWIKHPRRSQNAQKRALMRITSIQ